LLSWPDRWASARHCRSRGNPRSRGDTPVLHRRTESADLQGCSNPVWAFWARFVERIWLGKAGQVCRSAGVARAMHTPVHTSHPAPLTLFSCHRGRCPSHAPAAKTGGLPRAVTQFPRMAGTIGGRTSKHDHLRGNRDRLRGTPGRAPRREEEETELAEQLGRQRVRSNKAGLGFPRASPGLGGVGRGGDSTSMHVDVNRRLNLPLGASFHCRSRLTFR
jgi:hypothetical protein